MIALLLTVCGTVAAALSVIAVDDWLQARRVRRAVRSIADRINRETRS